MPTISEMKALEALTESRRRASLQNDYELTYHSYDGVSYAIYRSKSDANGKTKMAGVHAAVKAVGKKGYRPGKDSRFYLLDQKNFGDQQVVTEAFHFDSQFMHHQWIILGPSSVSGGSGRGLAGGTKGVESVKRIAIHEIAHTLHSHKLGLNDYYPDTQGMKQSAISWPKGKHDDILLVSSYAAAGWKEFVPEVFLGLILGKTYNERIMDLYAQYGGPPVPAVSL